MSNVLMGLFDSIPMFVENKFDFFEQKWEIYIKPNGIFSLLNCWWNNDFHLSIEILILCLFWLTHDAHQKCWWETKAKEKKKIFIFLFIQAKWIWYCIITTITGTTCDCNLSYFYWCKKEKRKTNVLKH